MPEPGPTKPGLVILTIELEEKLSALNMPVRGLLLGWHGHLLCRPPACPSPPVDVPYGVVAQPRAPTPAKNGACIK